MPRCKAPAVRRNEAYSEYAAMTTNKGNAADGRFSSAFQVAFFLKQGYQAA